MRAVVFPGQGSQMVGMGKALSTSFLVAREIFAEVDEALDQKLSRIMFDGPEQELMLTENAQPALLACSMAVVRIIESELSNNPITNYVEFVAGHSLGEYSALCAAGTFSLGDAVRLVKTRGKAMQSAVPVGKGAMVALLGVDVSHAEAIATKASDRGVCNFANDNAPGQVVLSGDKPAIERAVEIAKEVGAKRAIILPVSAPFHSNLMEPAKDIMIGALSEVCMNKPKVPLVSNVGATSVSAVIDVRKQLVEQVCGRVRWRESIVYMRKHGVDQIFELGHGTVLSGMIRRIDRTISVENVSNPEDVYSFINGIQQFT